MLTEDEKKASGVFVVIAGRNFVPCFPPRMVLFSNEIPECSVVKGEKNPQTKTKQIIHFNLLFIYFFLTSTLLRKRNVFILKSSPQLVSALNANSGCTEVTYLRRYHQQH